MPSPNGTKIQIQGVILSMMGTGLLDDHNFPHLDDRDSPFVVVTFPGAQQISVALKDRPYCEIYRDLADSRSFNIRMLDGALVQMTYRFDQSGLVGHRLAFFPSPTLAEFQNDPKSYFDDELYADIVANNIVHVPLRFDYDASEDLHRLIMHPKSHLTLGQYSNCRIPVSSPLTPIQFVDFILRNFYYTAYKKLLVKLPTARATFPESILPEERSVIHVVIPH